MSDKYSVDTHKARHELQYVYIPKLVADVNDGYLPSTALHVVFYNFPEPQQMPEALYGAVLIDNATGKAEYYTLEYGLEGAWVLGSKTTTGHYSFGTLDTRERSAFFWWVTGRIEKEVF